MICKAMKMALDVLQGCLEHPDAQDAIAAIEAALAQPDNTAKLYEELRAIIDGGSESFTHKDAVQYLKDNLAPLKLTPADTAYRPGGLAQQDAESHLQAVSDFGQLQEPFGYFKPETFGWTDCAKTDEEAMPLYEKPFGIRQPLTDAEVWQLRIEQEFDRWDISENVFRHVARAIEAAHGIGDK